MPGLSLSRLTDWSKYSVQAIWDRGYSLYVVQEGEVGPFKIGVASHPFRRLSGLQCGNHRPLNMRALYGGPRSLWVAGSVTGLRARCRAIEAQVLAHFADERLAGEWIDVPELRWICDAIDGYRVAELAA